MPPVPTELADKNLFQGDILDREIKIVFDPKTKEYLYDYAEKSPDASKALDTIKYYRISSPKLSEVEQAVVARQSKSGGPTPPGPTGEIFKAAEAQKEAYKKASNVFIPLYRKEEKGIKLTPEEQKAKNAANTELTRLERPRKIMNAKKLYNQVENIKNTKGTRNLNEGTNAEKQAKVEALLTQALVNDPSLPRDFIDQYKLAKKILSAEALLERYSIKPSLSEGEKRLKNAAEKYLNSLPAPTFQSIRQMDRNALEKQEFEDARAKLIVLDSISRDPAKLPADKRKEYDEVIDVLTAYGKKYPDRMAKLQDQYAELRRLYASRATEGPNTTPSIGNSLNVAPTTPELSNAAFQARRGKAQAILRSIPPGNTSKPMMTLQRNAQLVEDSFAMLGRANATMENKKKARNTISKSTILNNARKLGIVTGGRRYTKKIKKSRRKTKKNH